MPTKMDCDNCKRNDHCCIFQDNSEFAFIGIKCAMKIKKNLSLDYMSFIEYTPVNNKIRNELKNDDPSGEGNLRYFQLDKKNRILKLKRKKDKTCIFLGKNKKCTIYDLRPNICRMYPYWAMKLLSGKIKIFEHDLDSNCNLILSRSNNQKIPNTDCEKKLSKEELKNIKSTFKKIQKEHIYYKKNIKKFIKENSL
jgi:Fe-S-cluster containining protein